MLIDRFYARRYRAIANENGSYESVESIRQFVFVWLCTRNQLNVDWWKPRFGWRLESKQYRHKFVFAKWRPVAKVAGHGLNFSERNKRNILVVQFLCQIELSGRFPLIQVAKLPPTLGNFIADGW